MKAEEIKKAAVIGSGAMGHGIAQVFSMAGVDVTLQDIQQDMLDKAISNITDSLDFLVGKGKITAEDKETIVSSRLHTTLEVAQAVSGAQIVVEAVPEKMDLKKTVFKNVSDNAPQDAILASNTSTMSITELAEAVSNPQRFIGLHFFNPVNRMKLVEVIGCEFTEAQNMDTAAEFAQKCGKVPVKVLKDAPGFIVNRINAPSQALLNAILDEGVIEPAAVDNAMKKVGMPMGPFELADYVGLDVFEDTLQYYAQTLSADYKPGRVIQDKLSRGELGMKSGKGIHAWQNGQAQIDPEKESQEIGPQDFLAIQANEAVKVHKEGIARCRDDIDQAMVYGTKAIAGPFALAVNMQPEQLTASLDRLKDRYGLSILTPEPDIKDGSFKNFT
ncbi:MAG: 3-hydroxyacyl-CoA dehydrogenase family protein [Desulfosalsimonas sp.]